jgi:hypothetical protein
MIDFNATRLSPVAMTRQDVGQSSPVAAKRLAPSDAVAALGATGSTGTMGAPTLSRVPVDTFEAGGIQNARFGMPTIAPQQLGMPAHSPRQVAVPTQESSGSGAPGPKDTRPQGDNRSAAEIVNDSPVLAKLGRQKDIKFDQLCKQTGVDPKLDLKDPKQNPDAVYRLSKVLEFIDSSKASNGGERSNKVQNGQGDGNIEGITKDGDARHGTEAGMLKDFAEKGYSTLGTEHQLPTTNDTHVKADGSNKDNFQWFAGEAGKHLWFLPGVSNVLTGIGNSEGGFVGALEGAAGGVLQTWKGAAEGILGAVTTGRVNPASLALGAYAGALGETEAAPQVVKDLAGLF